MILLRFEYILYEFILFQKAFSFYVDIPSQGEATPIYRRLVRGDLARVFESKSPTVGTLENQIDQYVNPSLYYDPGWSNWKENALINNLYTSAYLRPGKRYTVNANIQNSVMAPDSDDAFLTIFRRTPPTEEELEEPEPIFSSKYLVVKADGTLKFPV